MVVWDDLGSISLLLIRFLQFVFNIRVATMKLYLCITTIIGSFKNIYGDPQ